MASLISGISARGEEIIYKKNAQMCDFLNKKAIAKCRFTMAFFLRYSSIFS